MFVAMAAANVTRTQSWAGTRSGFRQKLSEVGEKLKPSQLLLCGLMFFFFLCFEGWADFIQKPYTPAALAAKIKKALTPP